MLWVDVLNRGVGWLDAGRAGADLAEAGGSLAPDAHRQLVADLRAMRAQWAATALGRTLPPAQGERLRQWLETVTLRSSVPGRRAGFELPPLRAVRARSPLSPALDEILNTALLELLVAPAVAAQVTRCRGLLRAGLAPVVFSPEEDAACAAEAELEAFLVRGWQQCPRLVHAPRLAHYCSKACSNATFAARKGAQNPAYFAAKQATYRSRQQHRQAPSRNFSFID